MNIGDNDQMVSNFDLYKTLYRTSLKNDHLFHNMTNIINKKDKDEIL